MQVIHFDKNVQVCQYFPNPNIFGTPSIMTFSLLIIALEVWAIFLVSILWNLHLLLFLRASCVSLIFFLSIAPYLFLAYENFREKDS
jgi:hypothetical protein